MFVPRNEFLTRGGILLGVAATCWILPEFHGWVWGCLTLFILLPLTDLLLSTKKLDGLSATFPAVVRTSMLQETRFKIHFTNSTTRAITFRLGIPFPKEFSYPEDILWIELPNGTEASYLDCTCTPLNRGRHLLKECYFETPSLLKFWDLRKSQNISCEIKIYPDLRRDRKNLAALFLSRGNFGIHSRRQVGLGREFEKLRDYAPGDPYDTVHWKATAKRNHPVTKVFQIERTQEIYIIMDYSRLTHRTMNGLPLLESFITTALTLELVTEKQGDLFGLLTFSNQVEKFVRAKNGKAHYDTCRETLYLLQPHMVTPDFMEVCSFLRMHMRKRALLFFLTDLDDPVLCEHLVENLDLICRQHLIILCSPKPKNANPLFQHPDVKSNEDIYHRLQGHLLWHQQQELQKKLQRRGVGLLYLENERMSHQIVSEYLSVKQRQVL